MLITSKDVTLVVFNNKTIGKIREGLLMANAADVLRATPAIEELDLSNAMFLVETQKQLDAILSWSNLRMFKTLKLNCYFVVDTKVLEQVTSAWKNHLNEIEYLEITGPNHIPEKLFLNIADELSEINHLSILGRSKERYSNEC